MHLHRSWISLSLLSAMLAALSLAPAARADDTKELLDLVPEDVWGFAIARSLNTLDEKAKLIKETCIPWMPAPVTPMALGALDLGETIDMTRPICIVLMDVQKFGGAQTAAVVIVPATDPKALLEKLSAEEPVEGVCKCTVAEGPAYAATKKKFVILGPSQDCVMKVAKTKKTLGKQLDKARLTAIGKSDVYCSISLSAIVEAYKDMVMPILQMAMAASDPEGTGAEKLIKMFAEMAAVDFSVNFGKDGLSLAVLTAPKKDSDLEKLFRDTKNIGKTLLSALPKEKYLFAAGGTRFYSEHSEKFGGIGTLSTMLKGPGMEETDEKAVEALESSLKQVMKTCDAWAVSLSELPSGSDGMFGLTIIVETRNPKAYVDGLRGMYKAACDVSDDEDFEAIKKKIAHKPGAETIDGNKVDTLTVNLEELAEADLLDLDEDELADVHKIIGKDAAVRFGPAGDKHVVITFGGGKKRFENICGTLKAGGRGLLADAGISRVSGRLPSPRAIEAFIALDNIGQFAKAIAKALGEAEEIPFDIPTVDAPLAFSTVQLESIQKTDIIVPMKLISAVKKLIEEQMSAGMSDFDEDEDEDEDDDEEEAGDEEKDDEI